MAISFSSAALMLALGLPALAMTDPSAGPKIEKKQDLDFGTIVVGDRLGVFALSPTGVPKLEGVSLGAGVPATAVFQLQGPPHAAFKVKFPDAVPAGRRPEVPWADGFQASVPGHELVFNGLGKAVLRVGGTLHLPPGTGMGQLAMPPVELILDCAGRSATATFQLKGRLIIPIRVEAVGGPMDFGSIQRPDRDTRVLLDLSGVRSVLDGGSPGLLVKGTGGQAGRFMVSGEPEERVSVLLPDQAELRGPHGVLKIVQFRSDVPPKGQVLSGGQGPAQVGRAMVRVGATLLVEAGQPAGAYEGQYTVVFNYQ